MKKNLKKNHYTRSKKVLRKNICVTNINLREEDIGKYKVHIIKKQTPWDKSTTIKISMLM